MQIDVPASSLNVVRARIEGVEGVLSAEIESQTATPAAGQPASLRQKHRQRQQMSVRVLLLERCRAPSSGTEFGVPCPMLTL